MINKKIGLILAVGLMASHCAKLTPLEERKTILAGRTNVAKVQQLNQNDATKFCSDSKFHNKLTKDGLDKSKCSNCIFANNCSGCIVSTNNSARGWISLDELPQLDSLTTN